MGGLLITLDIVVASLGSVISWAGHVNGDWVASKTSHWCGQFRISH